MRSRNKFGGSPAKTATLWRRGKKWDGTIGWKFAGCNWVRTQPKWSDYFANLMKQLRETLKSAVPKMRVSKHANQASKHLLRKARARG